MNWIDVSAEVSRTYTFPGGETVRIERPKRIAVSENGHRIEGQDGSGHYVPKGWIHLTWTVERGPVFIF